MTAMPPPSDEKMRSTVASYRLPASAAILKAALDLSSEGILVADLGGGWLLHNQRAIDIWGVTEDLIPLPDDTESRRAEAVRRILASLAEPVAFRERVAEINRSREPSDPEELALNDGRTIERTSAPLIAANGDLTGRVWFFRDITGRHEAQLMKSRLAAIVEASPDAIMSADLSGRYLTWNTAAERLFGYTAAEIIGQSIAITAPPDHLAEQTAVLNHFHDGRDVLRYESPRIGKDGREIHLAFSVAPIRAADGSLIAVSSTARDITETRRAERALERSRRALATLSQGNLSLVRAHSEADLYQRMCDTIVHVGGYRMAWIGMALDDPGRSIRPVAHAGHEDGYVDLMKLSWGDGERGGGPSGAAVRTGLTQVNHATADDPRMALWREEALKRGYAASLSLPLRDAERVFGVLNVYATEQEAFGDEETRLLEELAGDIGFGVVTLRDRLVRDRLAAIVESSQEAIIGKTLDGVITSWNRGATLIYGYTAEEMIGQPIAILVPEDRRAELDWVLERVGAGEFIDSYETERIRKGGERVSIALAVSPTRDLAGRLDGASTIARDITNQKRIENDLVRAARFDSLTGLPNRASFVEALGHAIAEARRFGRAFAVQILDLDHFKDVNDTLGHPVGDRLLRHMADRLSELTPDTDMVARFGGDEFAILSNTIDGPDSVAQQAQVFIEAVSTPVTFDGARIRSGASVGVTLYGSDPPEAETILSQADMALYRAKLEGRGVYRFFTDEMDQAVRQRVTLGAELRAAIEGGDLFLDYQPQVDGRIVGLEALVRWNHTDRGVISPALFVPLAEETGLATALGRVVINTACRQTREWLDAGLDPGRVAINLSALQFRIAGSLERDLATALQANALEANRLELELTESVLMEASLEHGQALVRLRERGFRLAIDDFGTGYSSLDYLRRFPVDRIKIDQNFVQDLATTPGNAAIVRATIGLAEALGIEVIAEGVETAGQRDLLDSWGCRAMQGYFFARPMPAESVTALLVDARRLPIV